MISPNEDLILRSKIVPDAPLRDSTYLYFDGNPINISAIINELAGIDTDVYAAATFNTHASALIDFLVKEGILNLYMEQNPTGLQEWYASDSEVSVGEQFDDWLESLDD